MNGLSPEMYDDLMSEAQEPSAPPDLLKAIRDKVQQLVTINQALADEKVAQASLEEQRKELSERELPELFQQAGMTEITVDNIRAVYEQKVVGSIPKEDYTKRREVLDYLIDTGNGGIIKRMMTIELPKGDEAMAQKVMEAVRSVNPSLRPIIEESVHATTYGAFLRRAAADPASPYDMNRLNAFTRTAVVIDDKRK